MSFLNHQNNQDHTLPDVFTAVKHSVTARQVAEMYGIEVNSHGMACCPFHEDTHPSMKLDERYYCFGCQASGDAIDFVSNLFQIGKREAALKITEDFHIPYDPKGRPGRGQLVTAEQQKEWEMRQLQKDFREWRGKALSDLNGDYRILTERAERFAPTDRDAPFPQAFVQAYNDRTLVEFYIGVLETAPRETQINLYLYDRAARRGCVRVYPRLQHPILRAIRHRLFPPGLRWLPDGWIRRATTRIGALAAVPKTVRQRVRRYAGSPTARRQAEHSSLWQSGEGVMQWWTGYERKVNPEQLSLPFLTTGISMTKGSEPA